MSYTVRFDETKFAPIAPLLAEIQNMAPGDKLRLVLREVEKPRLRWLVYDWLHHQGLKSQFVIKTFDAELWILRKGKLNLSIEKETAPLPLEIENLLREMILANSPEPARLALREERINPEAFAAVVDRFEKIMS